MSDLDYAEVSREAHELSQRHGRNASAYAAQLANEALAKNADDEARFWQAVKDSLIPRSG